MSVVNAVARRLPLVMVVMVGGSFTDMFTAPGDLRLPTCDKSFDALPLYCTMMARHHLLLVL